LQQAQCHTCTLGAEISGDLVDVLQKKLNDAVLDVITVTLSRNPMCKLSPDDIQVSGHRMGTLCLSTSQLGLMFSK